MKFNSDIFVSSYRAVPGKPLNPSQKNGLSFLLGKVSDDSRFTSIEQVAYFLATIQHETNHKFQPIREGRERSTSKRRPNQDRYWLTGYYGRGYVQITWKKNYAKFGIAGNPDSALDNEVAYNIASRGMHEGMFTGHSLSDYFTAEENNPVDARAIINGEDKAEEIAAIYRRILPVLESALIPEPAPVELADTSSQSSPSEAASLSLSERLKGMTSKARESYSGASEGEKSFIARAGQVIWAGILGGLAFIQTHPIKTVVALVILAFGFWALHRYAARQDKKTLLINKG